MTKASDTTQCSLCAVRNGLFLQKEGARIDVSIKNVIKMYDNNGVMRVRLGVR